VNNQGLPTSSGAPNAAGFFLDEPLSSSAPSSVPTMPVGFLLPPPNMEKTLSLTPPAVSAAAAAKPEAFSLTVDPFVVSADSGALVEVVVESVTGADSFVKLAYELREVECTLC
jgi:hypothetical protein